jgi:hypothetical protein
VTPGCRQALEEILNERGFQVVWREEYGNNPDPFRGRIKP